MIRHHWALIALGAFGCSRGDRPDPFADEVAMREAYAKKTLFEADAGRAWNVSSTSEYQFEEGFTLILYEQGKDALGPTFREHAFRWIGQTAHVRLKTHGKRNMKLSLRGWANEEAIRAKPVMNAFVDGVYVGTSGVIEEGHYVIETIVPAWALKRPWVDLVIRTNAVGFHWGDIPELKVLNVYHFSWTPTE
jgi:hypothetical protein